jgi:cysteine synthase A
MSTAPVPSQEPRPAPGTFVAADVAQAIGATALVRLARFGAGAGATILAKLEGRNPSGSPKDRIAAAMISAGERDGTLRPGMELIEASSGNTAIALAMVAAARGLRLTVVLPESATAERRRLLAAYGAQLEFTPLNAGMAGAVKRAEEMVAAQPERWFMPGQFSNPANPAAHEATGAEILAAAGAVDAVISGVGTGGTITGIARHFRKTGRAAAMIAVEPAASPVLAQARAGQPLVPGHHRIVGMGAGFVPAVLDLALVTRIEAVTDEEAMATARRLARAEGILGGFSSGAVAAVALRLANEPAFAGKSIVAVLPDGGERYLGTALYDGLG